jgi:hypothetical protein
VSYAMIGNTVLEEKPEAELSDEAAELLADARAEAIEAVRELHREIKGDGTGSLTERPGYWLGRLEGAILGLVVAGDLAQESVRPASLGAETVKFAVEALKPDGTWIEMRSRGDGEAGARALYEMLAGGKRATDFGAALRLVERRSRTAVRVLETDE